jgi:hypothetical protein
MAGKRIASIVDEDGVHHLVARQRQPTETYDRPFMTVFTDILPAVTGGIDSAATLKLLLILPQHLNWVEFKRLDQRKGAAQIKSTQSGVSRGMNELHRLGIVEREGRGPVTMWRMTQEWGWRGNVDAYNAEKDRRGGAKPGTTLRLAASQLPQKGYSAPPAPAERTKPVRSTLRLVSSIKSSSATTHGE